MIAIVILRIGQTVIQLPGWGILFLLLLIGAIASSGSK